MNVEKSLTVVGLALTLLGAAVLSVGDLRGRSVRRPTWDELEKGLPRPEARIGFPLIVIGSALQIAGVAVS